MIIRNGLIFGADRQFHRGSVTMKDGVITAVSYEDTANVPSGQRIMNGTANVPSERDGEDMANADEIMDAQGNYVLPGLIDLHFHGAMGYDFCDGTQEAIRSIARYEALHGITAICPATLTLPVEQLEQILQEGVRYARSPRPGDEADFVGINMEGPFISKVKKGAQNEKYILPCSVETAKRFVRAAQGYLKIIGLAPEDNPDFRDYICRMKDLVTVSLAHTNANYETAMAAFRAGAGHTVHLYNAMSPMTHRQPGAVGAVADSQGVTAEIICDGNHVHPSMVRAAFRMMGHSRMVLISDSLRAAGLGDGLMDLGGQKVRVEGTRATLVEGGNLAGSVTNLADCLRIAVRGMDIPLEEAVEAATQNPARVLGIEQQYGSLQPGKKAHVLIWKKEDLSQLAVFKSGVRIA